MITNRYQVLCVRLSFCCLIFSLSSVYIVHQSVMCCMSASLPLFQSLCVLSYVKRLCLCICICLRKKLNQQLKCQVHVTKLNVIVPVRIIQRHVSVKDVKTRQAYLRCLSHATALRRVGRMRQLTGFNCMIWPAVERLSRCVAARVDLTDNIRRTELQKKGVG